MVSRSVTPAARLSVALATVIALAAAGCDNSADTGTGGSSSTNTTGGGTGGSATNPYGTADKINAYLDGKTLSMSGTDIPTDPNGIPEDLNAGQATQCYNAVVMKPTADVWHVTSTLGTLNDAPNKGDSGMCDITKPGMMVSFDSTAILIANVTSDCFDFTATYSGFGQEGRGQISPDGKTLKLELYFSGSATGDRCADGAVGAKTVKLNGMAFTGDAVQTYLIL